ncbi:hypothetical protein BC826DRAFT_479188 [Russula brevipes]|nr:hypothetical protein BC826DRAFT_479188 [Russula brevipes]
MTGRKRQNIPIAAMHPHLENEGAQLDAVEPKTKAIRSTCSRRDGGARADRLFYSSGRLCRGLECRTRCACSREIPWTHADTTAAAKFHKTRLLVCGESIIRRYGATAPARGGKLDSHMKQDVFCHSAWGSLAAQNRARGPSTIRSDGREGVFSPDDRSRRCLKATEVV